MVLISDKKYACETCIKGHRSSACKHTDRPLFEIKKKGRPVTQCEHCRELRKTKQVHVKCICEVKEPPSPTSLSGKPKKKGTPIIPTEAAFPHGVPPELASDSEQGGSALSASGCSCKAGTGECHCCTPRTRPVQRRSSVPTTSNIIPSPTQPSSPNPDSNGPSPDPKNKDPRAPSHHILARIAELRPVLPRMSARDAALQAQAGGQHDLFHGGPAHHHTDLFSPYGRAYDMALHGHEDAFYQQDARSVESLISVNSLSSLGGRSQGNSAKAGQKSTVEGKGHNQRSASFDGQPGTYAGFFGVETQWRLPPSLSRASVEAAAYPRSEPSFPLAEDVSRSEAAYPRSEGGAPFEEARARPRSRSQDRFPLDLANMRMCGCGDSCACPGCALHNPGVSDSSSASPSPTTGQKHCVDAACGDACLDCTMLGLSGFTGFGSGSSPTKQEDDITSPFDSYTAPEGDVPTQPPEAQLRFEDYDLEGVPDRFDLDLDLDLEGYDPGVSYGPVNAFEQIDEWIQALPPPLPSGGGHSPFEFGEGELAFDGLQGAAPPSWGAVQMFDIEQVDAPAGSNVLAASKSRSTTSTSSGSHNSILECQLSGLSGNSPDPNLLYSHSRGSSGAFLTVPGPDAHRRSRSSSSASSDVSSGAFGGATYGVGNLSLEQSPVPALKQQPPHHPQAELAIQHPALTIFPPPPSGSTVNQFIDDEQMSFF